jgi:hypothetical protein
MDYTAVDTTICRTGIGDIRTTTTPSPPPLPVVVHTVVKDDSGVGVVVPSPPPPPPAFSICSNNMLVTTPSLLRRNFGGGVAVNGSSGGSPETEEFESLERRLHEELEQKLQERKLSAAAPEPLSPPPTNGKPAPWSQPFVGDDADQLMSLQLVEKRQLRSFSRADEYLYAMKEDLGRLQF